MDYFGFVEVLKILIGHLENEICELDIICLVAIVLMRNELSENQIYFIVC